MAESFAFAIADRVLGKLGSALIQEVGLAWGVKTELEELNDTLSTIRAVLLDAEEKQATSHQLRDWLGKLKDGFYDAEDIVDEFEYEALRQKVSLAFNLKMGHRVKKIRGRLDKIAADKSKFNLIEAVANTPVVLSKREMTHSFVRASDVIGRDDDKENIVGLLMQSSDTENVSVIPIVGIGGLGKTTLAKLVYNDERVVGQFSTQMWVCVSDEFDIEKLIKKILKEIRKGDESYSDSSMEQLQSHLRNALDGEKFLLVLDDVWNTDREKWLKLKDLLVDGASGSKILVTTRKKSTASIMGTFPMQEIKGLSHDDCLSLFVKCAFMDEDKQYPTLLKIGDQIEFTVSEKGERDWVSIRDSEIWELEQNEDDIMAALKLSYYDLPYHLKQCFALFDLNLDGEGLIQSSGQNAKMEDIGERYINELLSRSFFQDVEQVIPGALYTFKMHDLVHDLAMFFAQPECLTLNFHSKDIPKRVQHVAISDTDWPKEESEALRFLEKLNNVHTIYFQMENVAPRSESFVKACILRFKCIRILDLQGSNFEALPNSIGSLKHLRYLNLSGNKRIKKLPNSISEGQEDIQSFGSLQTLFVIDLPQLEALPRWLFHGPTSNTLHHLKISDCSNLKALPTNGLQKLTSLKKLEIDDCPELIKRCKPKTGEDWQKIAHIPEIYFDGREIASSTK
ncbi:hypothetical protein AAG906_013906 [Vitis piasezkii]